MISAVDFGQYLMVVKKYSEHIREYQVLQPESGRVIVLLIPESTFSPALRARFKQDAAVLIGNGIDITIKDVPVIPLEVSGKKMIIKSAILD